MAAFGGKSPLHHHAMRVFPRFLPEEAAQLFAPIGCDFDEDRMLEPMARYYVPELPQTNALQRIDLMTFCNGSILAKTDNMSMAHSLEVRAPFLDRRLIDWALSKASPANEGAEKLVLRNYIKSNAPQSVLKHPKQGFSIRGLTTKDILITQASPPRV